jgi:hypothetical protein
MDRTAGVNQQRQIIAEYTLRDEALKRVDEIEREARSKPG